MGRYDNKRTNIPKIAIEDYAKSLEFIVEQMRRISLAMAKNDLETLDTRNFSSGDDGYKQILSFASALEEAFGHSLTQRSLGAIREEQQKYNSDSKKADKAIEKAEAKLPKKKAPK